MEKKSADQEIKEGGFVRVRATMIEGGIRRDGCLGDLEATSHGLKLHPIYLMPRPAPVQVERIRFPEDEPLVVHFGRNEAAANQRIFCLRECRLVREPCHGARRADRVGLAVCDRPGQGIKHQISTSRGAGPKRGLTMRNCCGACPSR